MIEWPDALYERYMVAAVAITRVHPPRPWWTMDHHGVWRRSDGASVAGFGGQTVHATSHARIQLAEYDRKSPIPHPGVRVGQIWGNDRGEATTIVSVYVEGAVRLIIGSGPISLETLATSYPFLVHDTFRPARAPWAPVLP